MDGKIDSLEVSAYRIPTEEPESDGTLKWDSTTLVVVHLWSGNEKGMGYTYSDQSIVPLIRNRYESVVVNQDPDLHVSILYSLHNAVRNLGDTGLCSTAIAAIDNALWDLRARLYGAPLVKFLGQAKSRISAYGSGGFTSYSDEDLSDQLGQWADSGFRSVKMKIGRDARRDPKRIAAARNAIGDGVELFVDANGAYFPKEACNISEVLIDHGVTWFEEPVNHINRDGLRFVREHLNPSLRLSVGEYGFDIHYFKDLLLCGTTDVLQADATRCGTTDFLKTATLCEAFGIPLSAHTAPSLHTHLCCAVKPSINVEYFHDHVRIEQMLFEGAAQAREGWLIPDLSLPGNGLVFKEADAEKFRV